MHDCTESFCSSCTTDRCTLTNNGATSNCCACRPNCDCKGLYLMNPTNNVSPNNPQFSPCSQTDVCNKNQLFGTCLETPGSRTVLNGGVCGNGLKDPNEECDCGGVDGCVNNTCCFANCTLKAGATCSDNNHGCCRNCTVIPAAENKLCRAEMNECDVPEYCTGDAMCPADTFKPNGLVCGDGSGSLKCASGLCTNRDEQCKAYGEGDITGQCKSFSGQCSLFCQSALNGCSKITGYFRDGTPCGEAGTCSKGKCSIPDFVGRIIEWILANQNISIVLGSVGGVIIFILFGQCMKAMRPRKANWVLSEQLQAEQRREERHRQRAAVARSAAMDGKEPSSGSSSRRAEATLDDPEAEARRKEHRLSRGESSSGGHGSSDPSRGRRGSHLEPVPDAVGGELPSRHGSRRPSESRPPKPDNFTDLE